MEKLEIIKPHYYETVTRGTSSGRMVQVVLCDQHGGFLPCLIAELMHVCFWNVLPRHSLSHSV